MRKIVLQINMFHLLSQILHEIDKNLRKRPGKYSFLYICCYCYIALIVEYRSSYRTISPMEKQVGPIVTSVLLALTFCCWLTAMVAPGWFLFEFKIQSSSSSFTVSSLSPTTLQK